MSKRDNAVLLDDIQMSLAKISRYVAGMDRTAFLADEKTVDAVVRNLEVIGEAVKQLPDDFKSAHTSVPWAQIAGLRNRIVHDYAGVDLEIIWQIVQESLGSFKIQIDALSGNS
jgi:uncharacterized protein with HEPN domain